MGDNAHVLIYTNEPTDKLPFSNTHLTQGEPCLASDENMRDEEEYMGRLMNYSRYRGCSTSIDKISSEINYSKIGEFNEYDLFTYNEIDVYTTKIPLYEKEKEKEITWNLYSRSYIPWDLKCE
jgi:hypothetical protein